MSPIDKQFIKINENGQKWKPNESEKEKVKDIHRVQFGQRERRKMPTTKWEHTDMGELTNSNTHTHLPKRMLN